MAEETIEKKETKSSKSTVKVIIGIVLVILGLLLVVVWWGHIWGLFKGCLGLFLILSGAVTLAIAKE